MKTVTPYKFKARNLVVEKCVECGKKINLEMSDDGTEIVGGDPAFARMNEGDVHIQGFVHPFCDDYSV